jgi:hypothetical protein
LQLPERKPAGKLALAWQLVLPSGDLTLPTLPHYDWLTSYIGIKDSARQITVLASASYRRQLANWQDRLCLA